MSIWLDGGHQRPTTAKQGVVEFGSGRKVRVTQLPVPENMKLAGAMLPMDDPVLVYDPHSDVIAEYREGVRTRESEPLGVEIQATLTAESLTLHYPGEYGRNAWLFSLPGNLIAAVSQTDGTLYLLDDSLGGMRRCGSMTEGHRAWQPACSGGRIVAVCWDEGGCYMYKWDLGSPSGKLAKWSVSYQGHQPTQGLLAVALRSANDGVIIGNNTLYSFKLPEEGDTSEAKDDQEPG